MCHVSRAGRPRAAAARERRSFSEGWFVAARAPRIAYCGERSNWKRQVGDDVQVQDVVAVNEHDLASLGVVEGVADPVSGGFGDLAPGDDEGVIHQDALVGLRIKDL